MCFGSLEIETHVLNLFSSEQSSAATFLCQRKPSAIKHLNCIVTWDVSICAECKYLHDQHHCACAQRLKMLRLFFQHKIMNQCSIHLPLFSCLRFCSSFQCKKLFWTLKLETSFLQICFNKCAFVKNLKWIPFKSVNRP